MTNQNLNQQGAQTTGLGVMIGRYSLDCSNMGNQISILRMLAVLFPGTQISILTGTQIIILSGTQKMNKSTTHTRDHSVENGQGKITNNH